MKKVVISMAIAAMFLCSCGNNANKQAEGEAEAAATEQVEGCCKEAEGECDKCKEEGKCCEEGEACENCQENQEKAE